MIKFKDIDSVSHVVNQIHLIEFGCEEEVSNLGVVSFTYWVTVSGHPDDRSYEISKEVYENLLSVLSIDDQLLDADLG